MGSERIEPASAPFHLGPGLRRDERIWGVSALFTLALVLPTPAAATQPATAVFAVRNATAAPIRCFLMEGGPITKLVTLQPGKERLARIAPAQRVSLACPKVRDTVFGPLPPGRYEFRKAKGRTELAARP